jgi:hypothetical protein
LCERWFCEKHLEPKLAFIKDLKAIDKIPEIRVLYYTEIEGKEGKGHPDFEYSRSKFRELEIEERRQNELIKQALDRMNHYYDDVEIPEKPIDLEEERKRTVEMLLKEDVEMDRIFKEREEEAKARALIPIDGREITIVDEGPFHIERACVTVPEEVWSNREYRNRIKKAKASREVGAIILEFYKKKVQK